MPAEVFAWIVLLAGVVLLWCGLTLLLRLFGINDDWDPT